jgi:uncharacterized protein
MIRTVPVSLLLATFLVSGVAEGAVKLSDLPSPRPHGWVTDLTGRIPPGALGEINRLGDEAKAQAKGEIAVAVVDDIDDANTRGFATRLFNRWGIGRRGINDGVLIFVSLDGHHAEIILGSGLDDPQRRRISEEIIQSRMAPLLREGNTPGALIAGMQGCAQRILDVQPAEDTSVSSMVTGLAATAIAFVLFLFFTRRAPAPWPDRSNPVRSARDDREEPSLLRRTG